MGSACASRAPFVALAERSAEIARIGGTTAVSSPSMNHG
jgi:hypothetical protein